MLGSKARSLNAAATRPPLTLVCVELLEDVRLAGVMLTCNPGNDPVSRIDPEATFRSLDVTSRASSAVREHGRMISVLEPLHGLYDQRLPQESGRSCNGSSRSA